MGNILIIGAGREGKGFLGQVFSEAGWNVSFLDKDYKVVEALKGKGSYNVKLLQEDTTRYVQVSGYKAYYCDEQRSCMQEVLNADIIALCVYPEDIQDVADYLAPCIEARADGEGKELTILSCTNLNHIINSVTEWFMKPLNPRAKDWFSKHVAVRDVIVRRSTSAESADGMELESLAVASLLIQSPVTVDLSDVPWMELTDNLEALKDIKIYTYNAPHATCAYAGYLQGCRMIDEAEQIPGIQELKSNVLNESVKALSLEFEIPEAEIWDFCTMPSSKEPLADTIFRVAYDPIRKLGRNDRLTGNACFCYKYNLPYEALAKSMANAFAYDEPEDKKAQELQEMIKEKGIEETVSQVCGLEKEHEIVKKVVRNYQELTNKDERRNK